MADMPDPLWSLEVTPGARLLLALMWRHSSHHDASPCCYAGAARLAAMLGCDERTVERHRTSLRKIGATDRKFSPRHGRMVWVLIAPTVLSTPRQYDQGLPDSAVGRQNCRPPDHPVGHTPTILSAPPRPSCRVEADPNPNTKPTDVAPTPVSSAPSDYSSGALAELDLIRREVEGETGVRLGRWSNREGQTVKGIAAAVGEYGIDLCRDALRWHATRTCEAISGTDTERRDRAGKFWGALWRGAAFDTVVREFEQRRRDAEARARAEEARAAEDARMARDAANRLGPDEIAKALAGRFTARTVRHSEPTDSEINARRAELKAQAEKLRGVS